jgi:putative endonuclease
MVSYWIYIASSKRGTLYIGVTNDLLRRMHEQKSGAVRGFTWKYNIDRLVYFEQTPNIMAAIAREKQIKGWRRERKVSFVESSNPTWIDLSAEWLQPDEVGDSSLRSE